MLIKKMVNLLKNQILKMAILVPYSFSLHFQSIAQEVSPTMTHGLLTFMLHMAIVKSTLSTVERQKSMMDKRQ
jgi:hypothetical protein